MDRRARDREPLEKALAINLDDKRYGTFAEIGAGQEVVRWFFRAGAAAGTIAKSISAYDMTVSDAIYGDCDRYVCRERLEAMLAHELDLNVERLRAKRGDRTAFFSFADTVAARGFRKAGECHGWMGVAFQSHPRDEQSRIILHVRMLDSEATQQQEALGIVGVNLLYGAFFLHHDPDMLLESLLDGLSTERIEIDMIEFSGIEFRNTGSSRVMSLRLVQLGLSAAAMFGADGGVLQPSEALRKKPVVLERGSFRPVTHVNVDMIDRATEKFAELFDGRKPMQIMEITMSNLMAEGEIDLVDFLARAEVLAAAGYTVLISDYARFYRLASYLRRLTDAPIGVVLGAGSVRELFDGKYYEDLGGGVLESFGRLFQDQLRLFAYPLRSSPNGPLMTVENLPVPETMKGLYQYLIENDLLLGLEPSRPENLSIFSRDVLRRLAEGDETWASMVPAAVADVIRERGFFGHPIKPDA